MAGLDGSGGRTILMDLRATAAGARGRTLPAAETVGESLRSGAPNVLVLSSLRQGEGGHGLKGHAVPAIF